jgi:hypothetical protein
VTLSPLVFAMTSVPVQSLPHKQNCPYLVRYLCLTALSVQTWSWLWSAVIPSRPGFRLALWTTLLLLPFHQLGLDSGLKEHCFRSFASCRFSRSTLTLLFWAQSEQVLVFCLFLNRTGYDIKREIKEN